MLMSLFEALRASRASVLEKPISTSLATCRGHVHNHQLRQKHTHQTPDRMTLHLHRWTGSQPHVFPVIDVKEQQENKGGEYLFLCNQRVVQQWGLRGRRCLALGVGLHWWAILILSSVSQGGEQSGPV